MDKFLASMSFVIFLFMMYFLLIVFPITLYTEAECLRKGYPAASVTVGLERYCMTLDGAVTVNVKHLSQENK